MRFRGNLLPGGVVFVVIMAACSGMPHEIFGWKRPENLATICHVWDEETQRTMMFNTSMAKRHIKHHDEDYWGECHDIPKTRC